MNKSAVCVDVGGISEGFEELGQKHDCLAVNLEVRAKPGGWGLVIADGTMLPFRDKSVDVCISNSVIEHVPEGEKETVASEIRRVSRRGYFVSVPYLLTPLEPHYFLPFFQFVPESLKKYLLCNLGLTIGWMSRSNYHRIRLLRRRDLRQLFPDARIGVFLLFGLLPVSAFAVHSEDAA